MNAATRRPPQRLAQFSYALRALLALAISLALHAALFSSWPFLQAAPASPIVIQGELVTGKIETLPSDPPPTQEASQLRITPETTSAAPSRKSSPHPQKKHFRPATPTIRNSPPDTGVALPLLAMNNDTADTEANDFSVPEVEPLTANDDLPFASRPGDTPLDQYTPTVTGSDATDAGDPDSDHNASSSDIEDPVDAHALAAFGKDLRSKAAILAQYPRLAKMRRWQGLVKIRVRFNRNGSAYDVSVLLSSEYKLLDEHALEIVTQASKSLPLPNPLSQKAFSVIVPVQFRLTPPK